MGAPQWKNAFNTLLRKIIYLSFIFLLDPLCCDNRGETFWFMTCKWHFLISPFLGLSEKGSLNLWCWGSFLLLQFFLEPFPRTLWKVVVGGITPQRSYFPFVWPSTSVFSNKSGQLHPAWPGNRREVTALISNHTPCRAMLLSSLQFSCFSDTKSWAAPGTALSTLDPKIPFQQNVACRPPQTGSSLKHLTSGAMHERNNFLLKTKHEPPRGDGRWWRSGPALED